MKKILVKLLLEKFSFQHLEGEEYWTYQGSVVDLSEEILEKLNLTNEK